MYLLTLIVIFMAVIFQSAYFYPRMPSVISGQTYYDKAGDAIAKDTFFFLYFLILVTAFLLFGVLPKILQRNAAIRARKSAADIYREELPNKFPEYVRWFGVFTLVFVVILFSFIMDNYVRQSEEPSAAPVWISVGIYILSAFGMGLTMLFRYSSSSKE